LFLSFSLTNQYLEILKGHDPKDSTTLTEEVDANKRKLKRISGIDDLIVGVPKVNLFFFKMPIKLN
jgi:hypothetical protein